MGYKPMHELFVNSSQIPAIKEIYFVLNLDKEPPLFLPVGTGGRFKGKDPNIPFDKLQANWIENALVVYIGKAGDDKSRATLRSRLKQYFAFGQGKKIGHWGGRLIWQLMFSNKLVVCWKPLPDNDPRITEAQLIKEFVRQYGRRPFANLAD